MQDKDYSKRYRPNLFPSVDSSDRRLNDRRKNRCEGYTYISTVGWICRRERRRRKCDCKESYANESDATH